MPGMLQSMESQRVQQAWATKQQQQRSYQSLVYCWLFLGFFWHHFSEYELVSFYSFAISSWWLMTLTSFHLLITCMHAKSLWLCLILCDLMACSPPGSSVNEILHSGRSPGEGNGNPLQDSCLQNPLTEEPRGLQSMESQRVRHS